LVPLQSLAYREVLSVLFPVQVTARPGDETAYVVTKGGQVWALLEGQASDRPVLDISEQVTNRGERGLLSMALVFGEQPFWRRLVGCWSAAIILWGCWTVSFLVTMRTRGWNGAFYLSESAEFVQFFGLALPLAAIAVQSPLWFFRVYLGWSLREPRATPMPAQPLSIRDFLLGTGIAALSVTLARVAPRLDRSHSDYWRDWGVFFAIAVAISLFSIAPAMLLMFRCRDWKLGYGLLVLYSLIGALLTIGTIAVYDENFSLRLLTRAGLFDAAGGVTIIVALAVFLGLGLKALRDMGFVLQLKRTKD
jgi:hypothetical protein